MDDTMTSEEYVQKTVFENEIRRIAAVGTSLYGRKSDEETIIEAYLESRVENMKKPDQVGKGNQ